MPIKADSKGASAPTVPAGTHAAICYGVVAVGTQMPTNPSFKPKKKVLVFWELPDERGTFDGKDKPRSIKKTYGLTLGNKSILRQDLESWRGVKFTDAELDTFEIDRLIGANCLVNVVLAAKAEKTYANVTSVIPLPKGMPKRSPENPRLYFNLIEAIEQAVKDNERSVEFPANMPEWLVAMCKESTEYKQFAGQSAATIDEDEPAGGDPVGVGEALGNQVPF